HYGVMSVSSVTIVGAFDAVGAILVVALMIAPAATAYLLTDDLKRMISMAIGFGVFSAVTGYWLAHFLDASIAGSMTTVLGLVFILVYFFAPNRGLLSVLYRQKQQRTEVSLITFLLHLNNHTDWRERHLNHLQEHINWQKIRSESVVNLALKNEMILIEEGIVSLTSKGQDFTDRALQYIMINRNNKIEYIKADIFRFR